MERVDVHLFYSSTGCAAEMQGFQLTFALPGHRLCPYGQSSDLCSSSYAEMRK
jgi:hypothetical protein